MDAVALRLPSLSPPCPCPAGASAHGPPPARTRDPNQPHPPAGKLRHAHLATGPRADPLGGLCLHPTTRTRPLRSLGRGGGGAGLAAHLLSRVPGDASAQQCGACEVRPGNQDPPGRADARRGAQGPGPPPRRPLRPPPARPTGPAAPRGLRTRAPTSAGRWAGNKRRAAGGRSGESLRRRRPEERTGPRPAPRVALGGAGGRGRSLAPGEERKRGGAALRPPATYPLAPPPASAPPARPTVSTAASRRRLGLGAGPGIRGVVRACGRGLGGVGGWGIRGRGRARAWPQGEVGRGLPGCGRVSGGSGAQLMGGSEPPGGGAFTERETGRAARPLGAGHRGDQGRKKQGRGLEIGGGPPRQGAGLPPPSGDRASRQAVEALRPRFSPLPATTRCPRRARPPPLPTAFRTLMLGEIAFMGKF